MTSIFKKEYIYHAREGAGSVEIKVPKGTEPLLYE
jgi:hypothetical protein